MLHPSYSELLTTLNQVNAKKGYDELGSRYGLVIAVARRARDLQDGAKPTIIPEKGETNLHLAIAEMQLGSLAVRPVEVLQDDPHGDGVSCVSDIAAPNED